MNQLNIEKMLDKYYSEGVNLRGTTDIYAFDQNLYDSLEPLVNRWMINSGLINTEFEGICRDYCGCCYYILNNIANPVGFSKISEISKLNGNKSDSWASGTMNSSDELFSFINPFGPLLVLKAQGAEYLF